MKHIKLFERFSTFKHKVNGFDIEVTQAAPNNFDGGVQIDSVTITCDGNEYEFETATPAGGGGDVHVKYLGGDEDTAFISNFNLEEDKYFDNELRDFLSVNDPSCVGEETTIDGFDIEITDFNHMGGKEFGFIHAIVNGEEVTFEMEQDATGSFGFEVTISPDDEEYLSSIGFEIDEEMSEYLFQEYDRICAEKR